MTNHVEFPGLGLSFTLDRVAFTVFGMPVYWYGILIAGGLRLRRHMPVFVRPGLLHLGAGRGQPLFQLGRTGGLLGRGPAYRIRHGPVLSLFHCRICHHQRHARIFPAQHQPQRQRRQRAGRGHHLADAEGAYHQAVCAQAFNEKPPQAIPHHIHQHHLAVEAAVLFIQSQQDKARKAPQRFI